MNARSVRQVGSSREGEIQSLDGGSAHVRWADGTESVHEVVELGRYRGRDYALVRPA